MPEKRVMSGRTFRMDPEDFDVLHLTAIFLPLLLFWRGWAQMRALGCCSCGAQVFVPCRVIKM